MCSFMALYKFAFNFNFNFLGLLRRQCYNFSVVVKRMPIFCLKLTVDVTVMLLHGI